MHAYDGVNLKRKHVSPTTNKQKHDIQVKYKAPCYKGLRSTNRFTLLAELSVTLNVHWKSFYNQRTEATVQIREFI